MRHGFFSIWALLVLAASLAVFAGVKADETDLSDGVFITHYEPAIQYSDVPPGEGWCQYYLDHYGIHSCGEQNPRIDAELGQDVIWFVLSAWAESKRFCGVEFGFDPYEPGLFAFVEWGACPPTTEYLEIPTPGWPGPDEGTAIARTDDGYWEGDFVPVYWFYGYVYGEGGIPLGDMPLTSHAGWGNCNVPPELFTPTCLGRLGINTDGQECCWGPSPAEPGTWGSLKHLYR